jgi:hypothetical protein
MALIFQFVYVVNTHGGKLPVDVYDQCDGYGGFGGRDAHDDQCEKVSFQTVRKQVMIESNKIDVYGVQHELYPHEHRDEVSSDQHATQSDKKDHGTEADHVLQRNFSV